MLNADEKREQKRAYLKEWRARKLLEDPEYNSRKNRESRQRHLEAARERERRYANSPAGRAKNRRTYEKHRDGRNARQRQYTVDHIDALMAYNAAREATPEVKARRQLARAVRYGKVVKPSRCPSCSKETPARLMHGHHNDYSKPCDVEWLCSTCHGKRHRID